MAGQNHWEEKEEAMLGWKPKFDLPQGLASPGAGSVTMAQVSSPPPSPPSSLSLSLPLPPPLPLSLSLSLSETAFAPPCWDSH